MAFFDDLKSKVGNAATIASDKTKEFAAVTKLKSEISSKEHDISTAFLEIGKLLYEREKDDPESPVASLCDEIKSARAVIEELKQRIEAIKAE